MQAKGGIQLIHKAKDVGQNILDGAMGEKQQNRTKEMTAVPLKQSRNQVVDGPVGQPGTTAVRGGEGRERSINLGINLGEKLPVRNKTRSPLRFNLNSNKAEHGKGCDLRDSRWIGKGLIVEVAKNGKQRVSWDNSKGGKSSFKWVIRAPIEQKEEVGIGLGLKLSKAHCVSNSSPRSASPYHLEAGECCNICLDPIPSTLNPDGLEENPTVSPLCVAVPVELSRSANEGSFLVSQLHVVSPATKRQSNADGFFFAQPWCASPIGVSGYTENIQHMAFRLSPDQNSILGSNKLSGGLFSEGKWLVTLDFVPQLVGPSFPDLFLEFLQTGSLGFGVSGKEANSYSSKDLLSLPREVMFVERQLIFLCILVKQQRQIIYLCRLLLRVCQQF